MMPRLRGGSANPRGRRRRRDGPDGALAERWTVIDGVDVFYRESAGPPGASTVMHLHGLGVSGTYLLPTATELADDFHTLVPDLPGFGRSGDSPAPLDIPGLARAAAAFLDDRGIDRATLVGNSMGCAVICAFAELYPSRVERAILVSPAGGAHNRPLLRALIQLARDAVREPLRLALVAAPDYLRFGVLSTWRLFRALGRFPSLDLMLDIDAPTLAVLGSRDPLLPTPERVRRIAAQWVTDNRVVVAVIDGAAHAINFSHPGELANVIRLFMADRPITDDPDAPGRTRAYEIHRGAAAPRTSP